VVIMFCVCVMKISLYKKSLNSIKLKLELNPTVNIKPSLSKKQRTTHELGSRSCQ
jgi:hypothetical protein